MSQPPVESLESIQFLSAAEAMKLLKVSRSMLHHLVFQKPNPLPSVKMGKARRYPLDQMREWMKNLGNKKQ